MQGYAPLGAGLWCKVVRFGYRVEKIIRDERARIVRVERTAKKGVA